MTHEALKDQLTVIGEWQRQTQPPLDLLLEKPQFRVSVRTDTSVSYAAQSIYKLSLDNEYHMC
jgi:hypothetical protein